MTKLIYFTVCFRDIMDFNLLLVYLLKVLYVWDIIKVLYVWDIMDFNVLLMYLLQLLYFQLLTLVHDESITHLTCC